MVRAIPDENGGGSFNPTALLKEKGNMLKGILVSKKEVTTMYGPRLVYTFKALDADCRFTNGKEDAEAPEEGALVDVFAPTRLARQLAHVNEGETVTMIHDGKKKVGRGQPAHIFKVTVE
jgi:hypothetical protein